MGQDISSIYTDKEGKNTDIQSGDIDIKFTKLSFKYTMLLCILGTNSNQLYKQAHGLCQIEALQRWALTAGFGVPQDMQYVQLVAELKSVLGAHMCVPSECFNYSTSHIVMCNVETP